MYNVKRVNAGFTLTELIIVIVILGIISAVITPLIGNKFGAVAQSTQRAAWVQQAEYALFHIQQDLAYSVPNSVFSSTPAGGDDQVIEFLGHDREDDLFVARYRNRQLAGQDRLQPNNDSSFDLFGSFNTAPPWVAIALPDAAQARTDWQNAQTAGSTSSGHISRVQSITARTGENGSPVSTVQLSSTSHQFPAHSPYYRAYFFAGPIGYECDAGAGFLYRVRNYTSLDPGTGFATRTTGAVRDRVVSNLVSCAFELIPGQLYSPPALTVRLEIGDNAESIVISDSLTLRNAQ